MSLELYSDISAQGLATITIDPIDPQIGDVFTLELFEVQVSFTATAATDANVVAGLKAAIEASADEEWDDITAEISPDGDRLILTYSVASGITKVWRGDAPAVAQVSQITASTVTVGDVFRLLLNGKSLEYTATAATATSVATGLKALIDTTAIPEFAEIATTVSGGTLTLTAATPGVPFSLTTETDTGDGTLSITQTQAAVAGAQKSQTFYVGKENTSFRFRYGSLESASVTVASDSGATVAGKIDTMLGTSSATCTITTDSTWTKYVVTFDSDGSSNPLRIYRQSHVISITQITAGETGVTAEVQRLGVANTGTFTITVDGNTTAEISNGVDNTATAANIFLALVALPQFKAANTMTVTLAAASGALQNYDITFPAAYGNVDAISAAYVTQPNVDAGIDQGTLTTAGTTSLNTKYSVVVDAASGTFTLTVGGQTTSAIAYNAATSAVDSALEALSSVDTVTVTGSPGNYTIEFTGTHAGSAVTLTGSGASLAGSGESALAITTVTASRGPNHWDDPQNWIPSGVPATGDAVRFDGGNTDCLYGLNQAAVLLVSLDFSQSYTGRVGLARMNQSGFFEYRLRDLTIGSTTILVGYGEGSGSGKIQIDTGNAKSTVTVLGTGGSTETGIPSFTWRGQHAQNSIHVKGGDFGTAMFADQSSVIDVFVQTGGVAALYNCSVNRIDAAGQSLRAHNCTVDGKVSL